MTFALPSLKFVAFLLFCSTASITSAQNSAPDPSGTWRWEYELDGKTREDSLVLNLVDGKVSGTFRGVPDKPIEVKDAKLKDNQLSCAVEYKWKDQTVSLAFVGKIKHDDLDGAVTITTENGTDEYPWSPKRAVRKDDVVGQWNIVIDANGTKLEPRLVITKTGETLQGKYTVTDGNVVDATGIKIKDNKLEFRVEATVDGRMLRADYSGRPYGQSMQGTIKYDLDGNEGEIDFAAKRQPEKK